jgi:hypothetical protein
MQRSVEAQSSPVEKFSKRLVPEAAPPSMAYRWDIDLSPGIRNAPLTLCTARMIFSMDRMDREGMERLRGDSAGNPRFCFSKNVARLCRNLFP